MQGIELALNKIGTRGDIALVKIKGYIDTTTSSEVSSKLTELINDGTVQLIIDMGGVNYVSSAGWGAFVGEIRTIRENGGDLKIVQMTPLFLCMNSLLRSEERQRVLLLYPCVILSPRKFPF